MEEKKPQGLQIELSPDVATGHYSNLAVVSHSGQEFFLDFVAMAPNMPNKVVSRIIMTPENAKNLLMAMRDNVAKYEATFGEIVRKMPKKGANPADVINPFQA